MVSSVLVPVGQVRDLPEPALAVLRGLWARLGYQGSAFVDMQLEITKELGHADFARFEREMLCNEIIDLRRDLDRLELDRREQLQRAAEAQANLAQVIDAEERTLEALLSEREIAKRALERAEQGVHQVVVAKEKEAVRAEAMGEELRRLEKERVAAVLYAKTAEEQAAVANMTAKAATAVAVSAVQSASTTPKTVPATISPRTPALWGGNGVSSLKPLAHSEKNGIPQHRPVPHTGVPSRTPSVAGPKLECWCETDEATLASKVRDCKLGIEEGRLSAAAGRRAQDRLKLQLDRNPLVTPSMLDCNEEIVDWGRMDGGRWGRAGSGSARTFDQSRSQGSPKSVGWNDPIEFKFE